MSAQQTQAIRFGDYLAYKAFDTYTGKTWLPPTPPMIDVTAKEYTDALLASNDLPIGPVQALAVVGFDPNPNEPGSSKRVLHTLLKSRPYDQASGVFYTTNINTMKGQTGKGYAADVYNKSFPVVKADGYTKWRAEVKQDNPDAIRLHKRVGFEFTGEVKNGMGIYMKDL